MKTINADEEKKGGDQAEEETVRTTVDPKADS